MVNASCAPSIRFNPEMAVAMPMEISEIPPTDCNKLPRPASIPTEAIKIICIGGTSGTRKYPIIQ